jgi:hypothetical protein
MSARDPLLAEIARLSAENEELRERVRQLEEVLHPLDVFPLRWRLRAGAQSKVLALLLARSPRAVRRAAVHIACSPSIEIASLVRTVDQVLCHVRARLREHCPGATIDCIAREGYRISASSKAIIEAAIAREVAGEAARLPSCDFADFRMSAQAAGGRA